jgi:hypothetical protein
MLLFHERFIAQKPDPRAVCAKVFDLPCAWCEEAQVSKERKLAARSHFFLQVYVHSVWKQDPVSKQQQQIMYKDAEGIEQPVSGVRLLELKDSGPTATLLDSITDIFTNDSRATSKDWGIKLVGSGSTKTFSWVPDTKVRPLPQGIVSWTRAQIRDEVAKVCPARTAESVLTEDIVPPDDDVSWDQGEEFP